MSNSSAWRVINAAEQELGVPVLERRVGGKQGGGSALTPEGRELLTRYSAAQVEVETYLTDVFSRHFAGWR
jgi:molybdate transport system regulatory protein